MSALRALSLALLAALALSACRSAASTRATVVIHYSHFEAPPLTATVGTPITITLRNDDPIEHEWIVGTDAVHERHRTGTEPFHDSIPTEITVPALSTKTTTIIFREPGNFKYICHLPGHEAYGMVGTLQVVT